MAGISCETALSGRCIQLIKPERPFTGANRTAEVKNPGFESSENHHRTVVLGP